MLQKTEPLSSLAAPIITLIPLIPATFIQKKYIYVCIYIYKPRKKTYLQSLYKYTHPIFYGSRFATEERGSRLWHVYPSSAITANGGVCKPVFSVLPQSTKACHMAPATIDCSFLWERWCNLLSPEEIFTWDCFFLLNTCIYSADELQLHYQLLHIKKKKMVFNITNMFHLPALGLSTG